MVGPVDFLIATLGFIFIIFCTLSLRKKMDGTHGLITPLSTVW